MSTPFSCEWSPNCGPMEGWFPYKPVVPMTAFMLQRMAGTDPFRSLGATLEIAVLPVLPTMIRMFQLVLLVLVSGISACASTQEWYSDAGDGPTPESWMNVSQFVLVVIGEGDQPVGAIRFETSPETVDACGLTMNRARLISDSSGIVPENWYRSDSIPSGYLVTGDRLQIVLNAPICDDNYLVRAKLVDGGGAGVFYWSSPWDHKILGNVAVAVVH